MRNLFKILILSALLIPSAGCYRMRYKFENYEGTRYSTRYWNAYFIYGLVPVKEEYSPADLCQDNKLISIETSVKPSNVFAALVSLGLSSSNTVAAHCFQEEGRG